MRLRKTRNLFSSGDQREQTWDVIWKTPTGRFLEHFDSESFRIEWHDANLLPVPGTLFASKLRVPFAAHLNKPQATLVHPGTTSSLSVVFFLEVV
jgi:hypothetical protein